MGMMSMVNPQPLAEGRRSRVSLLANSVVRRSIEDEPLRVNPGDYGITSAHAVSMTSARTAAQIYPRV